MAQTPRQRPSEVLCDWITAAVSLDTLSASDQATLRAWGDRICRYSPASGEVSWESFAWESVRSDSHQLAARVGATDFWIQGSPARSMGDGCAVFGDGPKALDLVACLQAMVRHAGKAVGVTLPLHPSAWRITRVDVTGNLRLGSVEDVRAALGYLRDCEGGRYRVSQQSGDTVYWSHRSRRRSGKAYAKGPHLAYQMRQKNYEGRRYSPDEIESAGSLLRLELKLGSQFWRDLEPMRWWNADAQYLTERWSEYFERMLGTVEAMSKNDLKELIIEKAPTEGQGRAAYGTWLMISAEGWENARDAHSSRTWYRNLRILRDAGLGDTDLALGEVVPIRRKLIECQVVRSWADLRQVG